MFTTILVPLDGSEFSEHAIPWAQAIALMTDAALRLVHVLQPAPVPADSPGLDAHLDADGREYIWQHLESIAADIAPAPPGGCRCDVRFGEPAAALRNAVRAHHADAVVMTTHGRGGVLRAWLGSVADELVRTAGVPVMLVRPPGETPAAAEPARVQRILVALDGSPLAETVLPVLRPLAQAGAELALVSVVPGTTPPTYPPGGLEADRDKQPETARSGHPPEAPVGAEYLDAIVERLSDAGLRATASIVYYDDAVDGILDAADDLDADVIALATHGRGGLRRALLGSVADRTVRRAQRPVLLHRPRP